MPLDILNKKTLWIGGGFIILLIVAVLLGTGVIPGIRKKIVKTELTVWGFDTKSVWDTIAIKYHQDHPTITVQYREIDPASYETELLNGLATGKGPDIFMIKNPWLARHGDKMIPAPQSIATAATVEALFPSAVTQELTNSGAVYALPLYMDTYAFIYNKDLFDRAGITLPPNNWLDFQDTVKKIGVGAAAIGGSDRTIQGASDIVALLMMQSGVPMVDKDGEAKLAGGESALAFYAKFANPRSDYYAWDNKMPTAFARFAHGTLPMMFGTHAEAVALHEANPALRIGVAPMPQAPQAPVNLAKYAALSVWALSTHPNEAWQFIKDITTNPDAALAYATATNEPPALRSLIDQFANDPEIGVFVRQELTARPWYRINETATAQLFSNMIESVVSGDATPAAALRAAESALNGLR